MDPNACAELIVSRIREGDVSEALQSLQALAQWLARGGFEPDWRKLADRCEVELRTIEELESETTD